MADTDNLEEALEAAAKAAAAEKAEKDHDATYMYDRCVNEALKPFMPEGKAECRAFLVEVQKLARARDAVRQFGSPWTGHTIVAAVLDTWIAYMTDGFAEARRFQRYGF
jgi:hypothetical protein